MPDTTCKQSSRKIWLFDTTLRDGSQSRGISFSINDKLKITSLLDNFGIPFIEGGWPGSNPKDCEYFKQVKSLNLKASRIVAFSSTRRKDIKARDDNNIQVLLAAETPVVCLFGKSWTLHVEHVLRTSLEENLEMIGDTITLMKQEGREVVYDAEHFFDGYRANSDYAMETLRIAAEAGATWLTLCDTNGGSVPSFVEDVVKVVKANVLDPLRAKGIDVRMGIHAHNDSELAVANSIAAVIAGCDQVQGTINGYGERCGNANLVSILANLQLKLGLDCIPAENLKKLTYVSHQVSEIANFNPNIHQAFVGSAAFAHKAGIHAAAVERLASSYEHINPEIVGNQREVLASELSGRGNIRILASELGFDTDGLEGQVLEKIKELEARGFQFEDAAGSFELLLRRIQGDYSSPFSVIDFTIVSEKRADNPSLVQAIVRVNVNGQVMHTVADAVGPVNALDGALRKALLPVFPGIENIHLVDYKVRILDPEHATAATTRVMIEAALGEMRWSTIGCSDNIIEASLQALTESFEYFLLKKA